MTLQQAIARQEGFGIAGTRATVNHNPGNLIWGNFAKAHGATGPDNHGYAIFPDDETGWAALTALLKSASYQGLTVQQALDRYCPSGGGPLTAGNAPDVYVQNVCDWCACTPSTVIDGLLG